MCVLCRNVRLSACVHDFEDSRLCVCAHLCKTLFPVMLQLCALPFVIGVWFVPNPRKNCQVVNPRSAQYVYRICTKIREHKIVDERQRRMCLHLVSTTGARNGIERLWRSPHPQTPAPTICGYCVSIFTFQMRKQKEKQKQQQKPRQVQFCFSNFVLWFMGGSVGLLVASWRHLGNRYRT